MHRLTIRLTLLSSLFGAIALAAPATATHPDAPQSEKDTIVGLQNGTLPVAGPPVVALPVPTESSQPAVLATSADRVKELTAIAKPAEVAQVPAAPTPVPTPLTPPTPVPIPPPASSPTEVRILSPQAATTREQTTNLVVQYATGVRVRLRVNGQAIGPEITTQTQPDTATNQVTQVFYAIPLQMGENTLIVQAEGGAPVTMKLTRQDVSARIEFSPSSNPQIPADGRSLVTLEGRILDDAGQLIPQDAIVTLTAAVGKFIGADYNPDTPGFQVLATGGKFTAQLQSNLVAQKVRVRAAITSDTARETDPHKPNIPLQPNPIANNGRATQIDQFPPSPNPPAPKFFLGTDAEAYTQVEFVPNLRSPIISGTINLRIGGGGNDFYGSFQDFLNPDRLNDGTRFDFGAAVFGTGRVGEWLVTAAVNTQRSLNQICDGTTRLFRDPQFCDQTYPVYGDSSTTDYLTPSIDSVYFRIERNSPIPGAGTDYAMWGDFTTSELSTTSQFYTATTRQLHGLKLNYNLGKLQLTGVYGNNLQGFQRDTIAPNGTSGYYFLSRRLMVGGSETIYVEMEELSRPGWVVERKQLNRNVDYEIDYDRGAILFRRPIQQLDFDLFGRTLRRQIVVTYQYEGGGDANLYAGRLQYNFSRTLGLESWLGASYLKQDEGDRAFELYGADVLVPLGRQGRIIGEIARSRNDSIFRNEILGNAYRLEVNTPLFNNLVAARTYYRSVDTNFSNNATFSFAPGQTRYGAEVTAKLTTTTRLNFQYDHEANYGIATAVRTLPSVASYAATATLFDPLPQEEAPIGSRVNNSLTTIRAGVQQKLGVFDVGLDFVNRSRDDRVTPNRLREDSNQFVARMSVPVAKTLTFRAQNELSIASSDPLYPDRLTLALDWAVAPGTTVRLGQQFLYGTNSDIGTHSFTSLDMLSDRKLSEDTTLTSRYSILNGVDGIRSQSAIGLNHRIVLSPGFRINLGYERITGDVFTYTGRGQQFRQPVAVGQTSASLGVSSGDAYSVGAEYTANPNFKATGRVEYRTSDAGDNLVISAGAAGKITPALTALVRYQQANFANQGLENLNLADTVNVKLGLAYRNPANDKFNALLRYEFRQNPAITPDTILVGAGTGSRVHLLALEGIYAPNYRWEFYGKFALRDTRSYSAKDLIGTNMITLSQLRATYRLGYRWDVGGEVRWINQTGTSYSELGAVAEVGYYLTPNLRVAGGYSYGNVDDRDFGDRHKGGFYIGLQLKLNELFAGFGLQKVAPPQQQESVVRPVAIKDEGERRKAEGDGNHSPPATHSSLIPHPSSLLSWWRAE